LAARTANVVVQAFDSIGEMTAQNSFDPIGGPLHAGWAVFCSQLITKLSTVSVREIARA
jgi:hypothetical protein